MLALPCRARVSQEEPGKMDGVGWRSILGDINVESLEGGLHDFSNLKGHRDKAPWVPHDQALLSRTQRGMG